MGINAKVGNHSTHSLEITPIKTEEERFDITLEMCPNFYPYTKKHWWKEVSVDRECVESFGKTTLASKNSYCYNKNYYDVFVVEQVKYYLKIRANGGWRANDKKKRK